MRELCCFVTLIEHLWMNRMDSTRGDHMSIIYFYCKGSFTPSYSVTFTVTFDGKNAYTMHSVHHSARQRLKVPPVNITVMVMESLGVNEPLTLARSCCEQASDSCLFTAFIDFRKASDVTDCMLLTHHLYKYSIRGLILDNIHEIYNDTMNTARINSLFIDEFRSTNGVLQGNNLSSTLFGLFINDLLQKQ